MQVPLPLPSGAVAAAAFSAAPALLQPLVVLAASAAALQAPLELVVAMSAADFLDRVSLQPNRKAEPSVAVVVVCSVGNSSSPRIGQEVVYSVTRAKPPAPSAKVCKALAKALAAVDSSEAEGVASAHSNLSSSPVMPRLASVVARLYGDKSQLTSLRRRWA